MATAETGNDILADAEDSARPTSRDRRFVAEIFDGADEALTAFEAIENDLASPAFPTIDWLTVFYEELAPARHALPRLVVVTGGTSGEVVLALPLVIVKEGHLRVARLADLGVAGYGIPLLGRTPLRDASSMRRAWRAVRSAMRDVDLVRFERMPAEIGDRPNPLLALFGSASSRASGNRLFVPGSFEDYLRSIGKKYRKDFERTRRLWQAEGSPRLYRATTDDEIAHVFATLEEQQAVWHAARGTPDVLADPACRTFYERLAIDGADVGLTSLFALEAGGRVVATLFGLVHAGTFRLLAVSTAGEQWSNLSPGRLVVLEVVKHLIERGVTSFDLGVNSNPLKHGFGTEEVPLYDLVIAQDIAALPTALAHEVAVHLRASRHLRAVLKKAIPRFD
ncbi:MAG: GNAT family N-acetyltransferase [Hyphomicrobium sp.]